MMLNAPGMTTATEERAIELLGSGISPEQTASAIGVSVSRISQLLSKEEFATQVAALRFKSLQRHNVRDNKYDDVEDQLLKRLENVIPMMIKPMEICRALATVNGAKRRGSSAPESVTNQTTVVQLSMPTKVVQRFSLNSSNQVINVNSNEAAAKGQDLVTMQSAKLLDILKSSQAALMLESRAQENQNEYSQLSDAI